MSERLAKIYGKTKFWQGYSAAIALWGFSFLFSGGMVTFLGLFMIAIGGLVYIGSNAHFRTEEDLDAGIESSKLRKRRPQPWDDDFWTEDQI